MIRFYDLSNAHDPIIMTILYLKDRYTIVMTAVRNIIQVIIAHVMTVVMPNSKVNTIFIHI